MTGSFLGLACLGLVLGQSPDTLPRHYDALRATSAPVIDGDLGDPAWRVAPWTEEFVDIRDRSADTGDSRVGDAAPGSEPAESDPGSDFPPSTLRTRAKILWDDEYLYIAAEMEEPHLWATLLERDDILYRDDDFEIFLDPDGDGLAYFELEINALGTEFDLFLDRPYNRGGRAEIAWDMEGLVTGTWLWGTLNDPSDVDRGWSVEAAIPWTALVPPGTLGSGDARVTGSPGGGGTGGEGAPWRPGDAPLPGDHWRVNFSRVDWPLEVVGERYRKAREPTREERHPESNLVWSPTGAINMHLPEKWGVVRFVLDPQNSPSERVR